MAQQFGLVSVLNTLAGVLAHECAIPAEQIKEGWSLLDLQTAWAAKAQTSNAQAAPQWAHAREGWLVGLYPERVELHHRTMSGRLTVVASGPRVVDEEFDSSSDGAIRLRFEAGSQVAGDGHLVAEFSLGWDGGEFWAESRQVRPHLIKGREDRLSILGDLDGALDGAITRAIGERHDEGKEVILAALAVLALQRESARRQTA